MSAEGNIANAVRDYLLTETVLGHPYKESPLWHSPIEQHFYNAFWLACQVGVSWFDICVAAPRSNSEIQVEMQARLLDWPIDYAFTIISDAGIRSQLAVECDGHDFHERTKEQAARDRDRDRRLQDAGITVYRFTGSEIYRDAFGCARQVLKWAENAAWLRAAG